MPLSTLVFFIICPKVKGYLRISPISITCMMIDEVFTEPRNRFRQPI